MYIKKKNKTIAPIINLIEATETGWIDSTHILIAKKAEPQIAASKKRSNKLFIAIDFDRKLYFIFWLRNILFLHWFHKIISLTIP